MNNQQFIEECLKKKGAYVDFPFGEQYVILKVKGKLFAQAMILRGAETVTLNCTEEAGYYYRDRYPGVVTRGYHCPPVQQPYFNSMPIAAMLDSVVINMIDESYARVVSKLPKTLRAELAEE